MRAAELYLESTVQDQLHLDSLFSENVSFSGAREMLFKRSIESHHPPVMRQSPRINKGGRNGKCVGYMLQAVNPGLVSKTRFNR